MIFCNNCSKFKDVCHPWTWYSLIYLFPTVWLGSSDDSSPLSIDIPYLPGIATKNSYNVVCCVLKNVTIIVRCYILLFFFCTKVMSSFSGIVYVLFFFFIVGLTRTSVVQRCTKVRSIISTNWDRERFESARFFRKSNTVSLRGSVDIASRTVATPKWSFSSGNTVVISRVE